MFIKIFLSAAACKILE